jgi:hypothetical protein
MPLTCRRCKAILRKSGKYSYVCPHCHAKFNDRPSDLDLLSGKVFRRFRIVRLCTYAVLFGLSILASIILPAQTAGPSSYFLMNIVVVLAYASHSLTFGLWAGKLWSERQKYPVGSEFDLLMSRFIREFLFYASWSGVITVAGIVVLVRDSRGQTTTLLLLGIVGSIVLPFIWDKALYPLLLGVGGSALWDWIKNLRNRDPESGISTSKSSATRKSTGKRSEGKN